MRTAVAEARERLFSDIWSVLKGFRGWKWHGHVLSSQVILIGGSGPAEVAQGSTC